jgi:tetratricopeptide (TPR) repeat protein
MAGWDYRREARARYLLGRLLADISENECAAELLGEAIRLDAELIEARVELGFLLGRDEDYVGMLEAFQRAIRADTLALREAVLREPEELEPLWEILRPAPPVRTRVQGDLPTAMPTEFRESGALVNLAVAHIREGRDEAAAAALRHSLRLDSTNPVAITLLALTCLLMRSKGPAGSGAVETEHVLRDVDPGLAELLFESER